MKAKSSLLLIALFFLSFSCKKKESGNSGETINFKKSEMLSHTANQIILPGFLKLKTAVTELNSSWAIFNANNAETSFVQLQEKWKNAVLKFHGVKVYEFGPSASVGLRAALGTFPTDTSKILSNSSDANVNLALSVNIDAIGFSALEYIFFRQNAKTKLIADANLRSYVDKLIFKITNEVNTVYTAWNSSYGATFSESTGTESTSGFSLLINEYNKEYELAKNAKLGIPIGKQSLGIPQIQYIESPYAKISLLILKENLSTLKDLFLGKGQNGSENLGFDDYLHALEKASLVSSINLGFSGIENDLNGLSDNILAEIHNNPSKLDALYTKMQNLVVHLKTDMTSAFGVLITYQDNDGD